jgi:hypothetical protein
LLPALIGDVAAKVISTYGTIIRAVAICKNHPGGQMGLRDATEIVETWRNASDILRRDILDTIACLEPFAVELRGGKV